MSSRFDASVRQHEFGSATWFALSVALIISAFAPAAGAQSRVIQKWIATVNDPANVQSVQPGYPLTLVNDATATSTGGVTVAGDLCVSVNSSGGCSNLEFAIETYNGNGQKLWDSFIAAAGDRAEATSAIADSAGNIYAAGWQQNTVQQNGVTTTSLILAKYAASGTREWIGYYGTYQNANIGYFAPSAVAVDAQSDAYVIGGYVDYSAGDQGLATLKFSPSGQLLWAALLPDYQSAWPGSSDPETMAVDQSGDVYIGLWNQNGGFLVKYGPTGNLLWQKTGAPNPDSRESLALDSAGNIYMEGGTDLNPGYTGGIAYAAKFDPAGNRLWEGQAANICSNGLGYGATIGVDSLGDAFLTSENCSAQLMVTKFDSSGNLLWQKSDTSDSNVAPIASYADGEGDLYVLAKAASATNGSSNSDFLTAKFDGAANLLWTIRYSGPNSSSSEPVAIAASGGNLFVTGSTGGSATIPSAWVTINYVQDAADVGPTSLAFSSQAVDTTSAPQDVTLKNTSSQDMDIDGIQMTGPFSETNNCSSEIVADGSCIIQVRFTPRSAGIQKGSLSISDQWAGSPDVVVLSGRGAGGAPEERGAPVRVIRARF